MEKYALKVIRLVVSFAVFAACLSAVYGSPGFAVKPGPKDQVVVRNPTTHTLTLKGPGQDTRIEPAKEIALEAASAERAFSLKTLSGAVMASFVVEAPGSAQAPRNNAAILDIKIGGAPSSTIKMIGSGRTQTIQVDGSLPDRGTFSLMDGSKRSPAYAFVELRDTDGNLKTSFLQFDKIEGFANPRLVARDADGREIGARDVKLVSPEITTEIAPLNGRAGSQATLSIDCSPIISVLVMEGLGSGSDYDVVIDYSESMGAQGPERVSLDSEGKASVKIKRGKKKGNFGVSVSLVARSAG